MSRKPRQRVSRPSPDPMLGIAVVPQQTRGAPGFTGRYLVSMHKGGISDGLKLLRTKARLKVAATSDFGGGVIRAAGARGANAFMLERLGIAVVEAPADQLSIIAAAAGNGPVRQVTRERYVHIASPGGPLATRGDAGGSFSNYVAGYRDGVDRFADALIGGGASASPGAATRVAEFSEAEMTWGLQATKASVSNYSGKGIKVAVLDTGMDLGHPDFSGRKIVSQSFVAGFPDAHDGHGHGTHCIGTACGPRHSATPPGYGIAYQADVCVGKVLNDAGSGVDFDILAGINWALEQGCQIVSISIGKHVRPDEPYEQLFEDTAKQALDEGLVIFAAAGNDSSRPFDVQPVSHPANCPSIYAVAALDPNLNIAGFSNSANPDGHEVNIAAPGVNVRSSWPRPVLYNIESGTSMATPHVAGIAALIAEATGLRGKTLIEKVLGTALKLNLPREDVGVGLVQSL
jgi:subtilisin